MDVLVGLNGREGPQDQTQGRLFWWRFGFLGFEGQIGHIQDVKELSRRGLSTVPGWVLASVWVRFLAPLVEVNIF